MYTWRFVLLRVLSKENHADIIAQLYKFIAYNLIQYPIKSFSIYIYISIINTRDFFRLENC